MSVSFLKKGREAVEALSQQEQEYEASRNKLFKFFLKKGEEAKVTFLTGDLLDDGTLDLVSYYQHTVNLNGKWRDFICVGDSEPCPLCASGNKTSLVSVFLIVDHRPFKKKDGTVINHSLKLFPAKMTTVKILQKIATKRGGLAGCTFDVSREGEKSPAVGDLFDFTAKTPVHEIMSKYGIDELPSWEDALDYIPGDRLRAMGFGGGMVSSNSGPGDVTASVNQGAVGTPTSGFTGSAYDDIPDDDIPF